MMTEQISAKALVEAAAEFLRSIEPELSSRNSFHAKVAANALAIVSRELAQCPLDAEVSALSAFLGHEAPVAAMRAEICGRLRMGQLTPETPGLLEALTRATLAKVAVDNPRYSTLTRMA